jgi:alpha-D-xyloside xylohydrolase
VLPLLYCALVLPLPAITVERDATGVFMRSAGETVRVAVCGPSVIHVVAGPGEPRGASPEEPWFIERCKPASFDFAQDEKKATLSTQALRVLFNLDDGRLTF